MRLKIKPRFLRSYGRIEDLLRQYIGGGSLSFLPLDIIEINFEKDDNKFKFIERAMNGFSFRLRGSSYGFDDVFEEKEGGK